MYNRTLSLMSAAASLIEAVEDLCQSVAPKPKEGTPAASWRPEGYSQYHDAMRIVQLRLAEGRTTIAKVCDLTVFKASVALIGEAEAAVEQAVIERDPDEGESGMAAIKMVASPKLELERSLCRIAVEAHPTSIAGVSSSLEEGLQQMLTTLQALRDNVGKQAEEQGLLDDAGFKSCRTSYHQALSTVEGRLAELQDGHTAGATTPAATLGEAFATFVAAVETQLQDLGATLPRQWSAVVTAARPFFS